MRFEPRSKSCAYVLVFALLLGAATGPAGAAAQSPLGAYLAGQQAMQEGDYPAAIAYHERLSASAPSRLEFLPNAMLAHAMLGQFDHALGVARELGHRPPSDQIAQMAQLILITDLLQREDYDTALARLGAGDAINPTVSAFLEAWIALVRKNPAKAMGLFDRIAQDSPTRMLALYHQALALGLSGNPAAAEALYAADTENSFRGSFRASVARAQGLSQLGRNAEALNFLTQAQDVASDPVLRALHARLASGERVAFDAVRQVRDGIAEVFYSIANLLETQSPFEHALFYARMAHYMRPDHADAVLTAARVHERMGQYDLAIATYEAVPATHSAFYSAQLGRAAALRRAGEAQRALEVLQELARSHGDLPIVHSNLGDALRYQEHYAESISAYDTALRLHEDRASQNWFLHYARAISHERLGQWQEAETGFRHALAISPDQPQVLNYLGYSLVEKRMKLDEALAMIRRAVDLQSDSGHIVDSLGWALYRLGHYDEAVIHMERAVELLPTDPVVNDHLGDVYWVVGRHREAKFQWHRALRFSEMETYEQANPDRIRRKLEVGLDVVLMEEGGASTTPANQGQ
ncbi:MAG: tetratricopeptide repeat protein [Rhodobacteraceae bacterium]|nr:tetratricopeptide repeat protein [Paracoccaceae bacterium]